MDKNDLYNQISPTLQRLYTGEDERVDELTKLVKKFDLDSDTHKNLVLIFGEYILGMHQENEFKAALQEKASISPEAAGLIAKKLITLIKEVTENKPQQPSKKVHGYDSLYPEEEEVVHSSAQDDALGKKPLTDLPTYKD